MPLFRALAKNMAASYFGKKAPYGFVMEVTLLYVFILCPRSYVSSPTQRLIMDCKINNPWFTIILQSMVI
jgi:hypothetical protein